MGTHLRDCLRPATPADDQVSAQTVCNCSREALLQTSCPLDSTAVQRFNGLQMVGLVLVMKLMSAEWLTVLMVWTSVTAAVHPKEHGCSFLINITFQRVNAQPHVAWLCALFLEAENRPLHQTCPICGTLWTVSPLPSLRMSINSAQLSNNDLIYSL